MSFGYETEKKLENETEVIEEEKSTPRRRRKGIYLEESEESKDAIFRLSKKQLDTLREKAREKGISMASYVREALYEKFASNIPEETKQAIEQLLKDCSIRDEEKGEGFNIEDKEGFLNQVTERKLTGKIWNPEQLDKIAEKFVIGWGRYFFRPDTDNLLDRFSEAMQLDKTQRDYFKQRVTEIIEEKSLPQYQDEDDF